MTFDAEPCLQDMIRSAYRLSWPGPAPRRPRKLHRLFGRVARLCRRQHLQGWPVALSR